MISGLGGMKLPPFDIPPETETIRQRYNFEPGWKVFWHVWISFDPLGVTFLFWNLQWASPAR